MTAFKPTRVNSSSCIHNDNYATKTGDNQMWSPFVCLAGIQCGTKISAPCFFCFCTPQFPFPAHIFFSPRKVSCTAAEICIFTDNSHAWMLLWPWSQVVVIKTGMNEYSSNEFIIKYYKTSLKQCVRKMQFESSYHVREHIIPLEQQPKSKTALYL